MFAFFFRVAKADERTVRSTILRAVVGGQDSDFRNGIDAGIRAQSLIAAVVQNVSAVDLPVVVLLAAAIEAIWKELNFDEAFILSTANSRNQGNAVLPILYGDLCFRNACSRGIHHCSGYGCRVLCEGACGKH